MSLDTLFGSPDWRKIVYQDGQDLFGPKQWKAKDTSDKLLAWYRDRHKKLFGHVSTPRLIKKYTRKSTLFFDLRRPARDGLKRGQSHSWNPQSVDDTEGLEHLHPGPTQRHGRRNELTKTSTILEKLSGFK